jgi:hypothetical protein
MLISSNIAFEKADTLGVTPAQPKISLDHGARFGKPCRMLGFGNVILRPRLRGEARSARQWLLHLSRFPSAHCAGRADLQAHCCGGDHRVGTAEQSLIARQRKRVRPGEEAATAEASPLIFRIQRNVQTDGKNGTLVEVQARVTNDEVQDREAASHAYELLERLASLAGKNPAPSENKYAREAVSPSTAKPPIKSRATSAKEGSPVHAVITKIDRVKTRQGDSLFLKVDVGGETVRVFGRPEELAERLEASAYDIPASEIEAGMELHLPCLVKVGQGKNGYKNIEEFLPEAAEWPAATST